MSTSPIDLSKSAFTRQVQRKSLACLEIRHPAFRADILLQGAQLLQFAPTGQDSWVWLSDSADYVEGVSVRGGIPVCWPWFGNADRNPASVQAHLQMDNNPPAHGFARTQVWQISDLYEAADRVEVEMTLQPGTQFANLWNGSAEVKARWVMTARSLSMSLTTLNTGTTPLTFSQALHTYFPTTSIQQTRLQGLHGSEYLETLEGWVRKTQTGDVSFTAETDRIYFPAANQSLQLVTPQQTLQLGCDQSASCIVWNPWIAKARRLGQFQPDAWQSMFCVETANAADDVVTLAAGSQHRMTLTLSRS